MKCLSDCVSVRLSGRSSVLQVQRGGVWRTVCSEGWNNLLGLSACKQLGYSRSSCDTDPHPQIWIVLHGSELCVALSHLIIKTTRTQRCLLELQRSDPQPSVLCVSGTWSRSSSLWPPSSRTSSSTWCPWTSANHRSSSSRTPPASGRKEAHLYMNWVWVNDHDVL